MRRLFEHIQVRNNILSSEFKLLQQELQGVFQKKILSAGVLQPGYFNDFYPILERYKNSGQLSRYMITEEEYTEDGKLFKVPVVDVNRSGEQSSIRIFLQPF